MSIGPAWPATGPRETASEPRVIPVRHTGRWLSAAVVFVLLVLMVWSLSINKAVDIGRVRHYLLSAPIRDGAVVTVELTVLAMLIGIGGGILFAVMRLSPNPVLSWVSWLFTWFFRGTPLVVQLVFWGYLGSLYSGLGFGIPGDPSLQIRFGATNQLITPFVAALLGLGLNEAAYASEIVRAGILSVDEGQSEAASALGMTRAQTMRRIVLPQAMRTIIPPMGNETLTMLKSTGLVFVIGGSVDLFATAQNIYGQNFQTIPLLIVASLWYLALTSVLSVGQHFLERRFSRGHLAGPARRRGRWRAFGGAADAGPLGPGGGARRSR